MPPAPSFKSSLPNSNLHATSTSVLPVQELLEKLKSFYSEPLSLLLNAINTSLENACTVSVQTAEMNFAELDAAMEALADATSDEEAVFDEIARGVECLNLLLLELEKKKELIEGVPLKQIGKEIQENDSTFAYEYVMLKKVKMEMAAINAKAKQVAGSLNALKDSVVMEYEFKFERLGCVRNRNASYAETLQYLQKRSQ